MQRWQGWRTRAGSLLLMSKLLRGVKWGRQGWWKVQAGQVRQRPCIAIAHGGCLKVSTTGSPCSLRRCPCCTRAGCQCCAIPTLILGQVNIDSRDITGFWSVLLMLLLLLLLR